MAGRSVVIQKDRRMVADELADHLRAPAWERDQFRRLSMPTLLKLANATIPAFVESVTVAL